MPHYRAQPSLLIGGITLRRAGLTRLDVLVVIGLLWLVAGAGLQSAQQQWETSNRIACGSNLRQIGQAMRQYAIDDVRGGNYPRTLYDPATADKPNFGTPYEGSDLKARDGVDPFVTRAAAERGHVPAELVAYAPAPNDVTAAFWHLLRSTELTVPVFICPSTRREPLPLPEGGAGKMQYTNWPGIAALRDHLSFSFHNMYATPQGVARGHRWTDALNSTFVLAADMNPGTDELLGLMVKTAPPFKPDGTPADDQPRPYNSPNHFGYGQNVLFADGSVKFMVSPMAGVQGDNIYAYREGGDPQQAPGEVPSAGIIGAPSDLHDSVLLPTAAQLKQQPSTMPAEAEAQRAMAEETWRADLLRRYGERGKGGR